MELERLRVDVHQHVLDLRSVEGTIHKSFFTRLFNASDEDGKKIVRAIIMRADKPGLARWMENHQDIHLGEMSHNRLKRLGRQLNIPNYSRLDAGALAQRIEEHRNGIKNRPTCGSSYHVSQDAGDPDRSQDQTEPYTDPG
jgi:hypothetical protein